MIIKDQMKPQPRGKKNEEKNKAMLTQNDLQQIRQVVQETIQVETPKIVKQGLNTAIDQQIRPVIQQELKKELTSVKRKLNSVAKDLDYVIRSYDARLVALETDMKDLKQN